MFNIHVLIDDAKCFQTVRDMRWPDGVCCPQCNSKTVICFGKDDTQKERQRYQCHACNKRFDDLTGTVFAGHHQPLRTWIMCLYLMGLNLSSLQIANELDLNRNDVKNMVDQLRKGIVDAQPVVQLEGEVELDEVYIVAGHKGNPEAVKKKANRTPQTIKGRPWSWDLGERKAARFWNDSAWWTSSTSNAGECTTEDD